MSGMRFIPPIGLRVKCGFTSFFSWEEAVFALRVDCSRMGGTMTTTTWKLQWIFKGKEYEASFCWRPSVTRYWLSKHK